MCGIYGFNFKDKDLSGRINKVLGHRGPDDEGDYAKKGITLGHRRLSILDLSKAGHQPMNYKKGKRKAIITYNGEIYNFKEIKGELEKKGYQFSSNTDTEVILAAYLEYGFDCLDKFTGMWAFCIYDPQKNILFLAADRFGKKPLYYYDKNEEFIFSSEIKGILEEDRVERKVNKKIMADYLYNDMTHHSEETFFQDVKCLRGGEYIVYDLKNSNMKKEKYFDFKPGKGKKEELKETVRALDKKISKSVEYRMVSDVPVSISLSGGIDSSTIGGIIGKKFGGGLKAFTLSFEDESADDETKAVKNILKKYSSFNLHEVKLENNTFLDNYKDIIWHQEEPIMGDGAYVRYMVAKDVGKENIKVLLTGEGGDESFTGYKMSYAYYLYEMLKDGKLRDLVGNIAKRSKSKDMAGLTLLTLPRTMRRMALKKRARTSQSKLGIHIEPNVSSKEQLYQAGNLNEYLYNTLKKGILPRLLSYNDKMAMAHCVESRSPLLERNITSYALNISREKKVHDGYTKYVLRKVGEKYIPKSIMWNREKSAFLSPLGNIMRSEEVQKVVKEMFEEQKSKDIFDGERYLKLYDEYVKGDNSNSSLIMKGFWIEAWYRKFDVN